MNLPSDGYLREAAALCRKHGALFVADEIQTGLGRTGRMWAVEHWGVEPDMLLSAKALSGGFAPIGAVAMREPIFDSLFSSLVRAPVHGSTFSKNTLAMAAGLATLEVIREEKLVENAAKIGEALLDDFRDMIERYDFVHAVRGKGMMQAIEFAPPDTLKAKMAWKALDTAQSGLFSQLVIVPLFHDHHILTQTASHHHAVVNLGPGQAARGDRDPNAGGALIGGWHASSSRAAMASWARESSSSSSSRDTKSWPWWGPTSTAATSPASRWRPAPSISSTSAA